MFGVVISRELMSADSGLLEALALILAGCVCVLQVAIKVGAFLILLIFASRLSSG